MKKVIMIVVSLSFMIYTNLFSQNVTTFVEACGVTDDMVMDSDGNLFGSNYNSGKIYKITPDGDVSLYLEGLDNSNGLVFNEEGDLIVADLGGNQIYKVTSENEKIPYGPSITSPSGLIFKPGTTDLYVSTYTDNKIKVLSEDGTVEELVTDDRFNGPVGMTFDENETLYIANFSDGKIFSYTEHNGLVDIVDMPHSTLGFIKYVNGFLYVTMMSGNRLYKVSLDGEYTLFAGTGSPGLVNGPALEARFSSPNGITFADNFETMYISDYGTQTIRKITNIYLDIDDNLVNNVNDYKLYQNYPNPFNPSTKINYDLPYMNYRKAEIIVYNSTGQQIWSSGNLSLSIHRSPLLFDGSKFNSGIYYYSLVIDDKKIDSKSMILIK